MSSSIQPEELALVVGLEGEHEQAVAVHGQRPRVLGLDLQVAGHLAARDIDDGDAVGLRQRDIGLVVAGEGDAHGFVEVGGIGRRVEVLHRGDDLMEGPAPRVGVDDADRVGDMVADPHLLAVRAYCQADRIYADIDPQDDPGAGHGDDIDGVRRRIGDVDVPAVGDDRIGVGAGEGRVADLIGQAELDSVRGVARQAGAGAGDRCGKRENADRARIRDAQTPQTATHAAAPADGIAPCSRRQHLPGPGVRARNVARPPRCRQRQLPPAARLASPVRGRR